MLPPAPVRFSHHVLAEGLRQRGGEQAREDVRGAAGGEGDDDADRMVEGLGGGGTRRGQREGAGGGAEERAAVDHVLVPSRRAAVAREDRAGAAGLSRGVCARRAGGGLQSPAARAISAARTERGRSSGVEHDLAKVGVEGSNPFARSNLLSHLSLLVTAPRCRAGLAVVCAWTLMVRTRNQRRLRAVESEVSPNLEGGPTFSLKLKPLNYGIVGRSLVPKVSKSIAPAIALLREKSTDHQAFSAAPKCRFTPPYWTYMDDIDRVFARFKDDKPEPTNRRETLSIPRRKGAGGSRTVEVVHLRSGGGIKDRPQRVDPRLRAASGEAGLRAQRSVATADFPAPIPVAAITPTKHVMPAWAPAATKEAPSGSWIAERG